MANSGSIYFLLPGLFWPKGLQQLEEKRIKPKKLIRILSRSTTTSTGTKSLHESIFQQFGVIRQPNCDLPIAAVTLRGLNQEVDGNDCWGCASPVNLFADRDRVILLKLAEQDNLIDKIHLLTSCFNNHFKSEGISVHACTPVDWFMKLRDCPKLHTFDLEQVIGRHIEEFLPQGEDKGKFRSLMNEIQMLFFQISPNISSHNERDTYINGLWVYGLGKIPQVHTNCSKVYSNKAVLKGLANLSGIECEQVPDDLSQLASVEGNLLIVINDLFDCELEVDTERWADSIINIDENIGKLVCNSDLSPGRKVIIDSCIGKKFSLTPRRLLFSFYKKHKKLTSF